MTRTAESVCLAADQGQVFIRRNTIFCMSASDVGSNETSGSMKHVFSTNGEFEELGTSRSARITRIFSLSVVQTCYNHLQGTNILGKPSV